MKNNLDNWEDIFVFPTVEDYTDSIIFKNFLIKKQDEKKDLKLNKQIKKKKYQISNMFNKKFGKNFLNQKPESLKIFEKRLAKYLFDPDSKFLAKFPKLQRRLRHEKKISEELLKEKINIGSMVYFDLYGKNAKKTRNINNSKEKMLTISKNFSYRPAKDIVGNTFYQIKFWNNYSKNMKNLYKNKLSEYRNNYIDENDIELNNENSVLDGEDNNYIKDLIIKDSNIHSQREKTSTIISNTNTNTKTNDKKNKNNTSCKFNSNKKLYTLNNNAINNSENLKNEKQVKYNTINGKNRSVIYNGNADKLEHSFLDIKNNDSNSNSIAKKPSNIKKNSIFKTIDNNNIVENGKIITSYTEDSKKFENIIPKIRTTNSYLSRNKDNRSSLITSPNTTTKNKKYKNILNIKANNKKFTCTSTDFNSKKLINKSLFKTFTCVKNKSKKRIDDALKKKQIKFKNNLDNQIVRLNQYNNKCNSELIKLIDGNNDDNYKERKMKIINKTKLDIKEILVDKKKILDKKEASILNKEKDTIKNLIKIAIYDTGDNYGVLDLKKQEKLLKKGINHFRDEQALKIIDNMVDKEIELDVRKIIGNGKKNQMRNKNHMELIRIKVQNNYKKMLQLKNMILIDKGKVFDHKCS